MKSLLAFASILFICGQVIPQQQKKDDLGLPELNTIKTATLSPSYSCRSKEEFRRGYDRTALFLSRYSDDRNSPDLLFNGACGSADDFDVSTAFSVADYVPNKKVDLRYAVREYQVLDVKAQSEGFDWGGKNQAPCDQKAQESK